MRMNQNLKNKPAFMASIFGVLLFFTGTIGLSVASLAQEVIEEGVEVIQDGNETVIEGEEVEVIEETKTEQTPSVQDQALSAVAKMTEGQRTYYKDNGKFQDQVDVMEQDFGITLPPEYDSAIRITDEAAYNYVIPTGGSLKAYVGAAFLAPDGKGELTTIICENKDTGLERPADPQLVRDPLDTSKISLQCGENSIEVPASKVTQ